MRMYIEKNGGWVGCPHGEDKYYRGNQRGKH
jgi:hypothetical protein